jgi:separase
MRNNLCSLYHAPPVRTKQTPKKLTLTDNLHLLSLPLPSSNLPIISDTLTLLSTYLLHAITSVSHSILSSTTTTKTKEHDIESLSKALTETTTLLAWIPLISSLPAKHRDFLLTSAYTTLTKLSSNTSQSGIALFNIRSYALSCLLYTTPGTVEPDTFWNQATKFGGTLVSGATADANAKDTATRTILSSFSNLTRIARERDETSAFLTGRGFVTFCEYWMKFAKRVSYFFLSRTYTPMLIRVLDR